MPETRPKNLDKYLVLVDGHGREWTWEIRRVPPLGIRLYSDSNFVSESAAKLAGEKALYDLLKAIAEGEA
jgi:hypothetical protein